MINLRVGQEVTLIWSTGGWVNSDGQPITGPTFGEVYVVDFIEVVGNEAFLEFAQWPFERWLATRFKPVERPVTDISVFTAMLAPAPKQKEVEHVE